MSCKECIDASAVPASELGFGGRFSRWFHRTVCPPCRAYFRGLDATERLLSRLGASDVSPPGVSPDPDSAPRADDAAREADLRAALRARSKGP